MDSLSSLWTRQSTRSQLTSGNWSKDKNIGEHLVNISAAAHPLVFLMVDIEERLQCFLWFLLLSRLFSRAPNSWSRSFESGNNQNHKHYQDVPVG